jgi:hypothetical protein
MRRKEDSRTRGRIAPIHALFAAAMLGLLVMPLALAGAKPGDATSSAKPAKQLKSLKRRVAALEARQSPAALPPNGLAGGDLIGNYPNPQIGPGAIHAAEFGREISLQTQANVAPGERQGLSVTCPDGSRLLSGGFDWGNSDGAGARVLSSGTVVPDGVNPNLDPNNNPVWGVQARVDAGGQANTIFAKALCLAP